MPKEGREKTEKIGMHYIYHKNYDYRTYLTGPQINKLNLTNVSLPMS